MHQNNYYFSTALGQTLCFTSDSAVLDNEFVNILRAYIPGLAELEERPPVSDMFFKHVECPTVSLIQNKSETVLYGPWGEGLKADLHHLLYAAVRQHLLNKNLFSVHSACVEKNGKYILILGHSGSGKTATAMKLAKDFGMNIVSGNKTVAAFDDNRLLCVTGTSALSIRKVDEKHISPTNKVLNYTNRCIYSIGATTTVLPGEIQAIAIVRLNDFTEEVSKLEIPESLHALYPYFLDVVNADVITGSTVFVGTPPVATQEALVISLKRVLEFIPVYTYIGSAAYVADKISQL